MPFDIYEAIRDIGMQEEEWLSGEMAKLMPAEMFLRAYGNHRCKLDVVQWLKENGYELRKWPDLRVELVKDGTVLSEWYPYFKPPYAP